MNQNSSLTRKLSDAQVKHAESHAPNAVIYRIYTEDKPGLADIIARYFDGATLFLAAGLWQGSLESARVIEIVGTTADMQKVFDLAGDIRVINSQTSVLIAWCKASSFVLTAEV